MLHFQAISNFFLDSCIMHTHDNNKLLETADVWSNNKKKYLDYRAKWCTKAQAA